MPPMRFETALVFWWLNVLNKKRRDQLVEACGSLDDALGRLSPDLMRAIGMRQDSIEKAFARLEEFDAEAVLARMERLGVGLLSLDDDAYPRLLRESADPPVFLSYRGDPSVLDRPCVAVVGTRDMTPEGERLAEWIVPEVVRAGCTAVSGLAFGIDAVVAQSAMDAGGVTAAVLGGGLANVSPKTNERLGDLIVKNGGVVLTEYPLDEPAQPFTFPARNRIVAALSLATVVVQAPAKSGALITARLALDDNREVLACPGSPFDPSFEGCNALIADGARLLRTPADVLSSIGVVAPAAGAPVERSFDDPAEAAVHAVLTTLPSSMDDIVERTGKAAGELAGILTMLELAGAAAKAGEGWVRS